MLPERQGGLAGCPGEDSEVRDCSTNTCPAFTPWSEWSACTVSCGGGQRTAQRECVVARTEEAGALCEGSSLRTEECNTGQCEQWTPWAPWTSCTRSCGGGSRRRVRQCTLELTRSGRGDVLPDQSLLQISRSQTNLLLSPISYRKWLSAIRLYQSCIFDYQC